MGRWQPGAQSRLAVAAMQLFAEQGYEQTTVADIAGRAGLTARTFFRYFSDKREVVFAGGSELEAHLAAALAAAPAQASAMQAVELAFDAAAELISSREWSALRQVVVASHPELRERELTKMASLSTALAAGLRARGVPAAPSGLAAEAGVMVFRLAFERWVGESSERTLSDVLLDGFAQLRSLAADGGRGPDAGLQPDAGAPAGHRGAERR